jgi:hypothetical protein
MEEIEPFSKRQSTLVPGILRSVHSKKESFELRTAWKKSDVSSLQNLIPRGPRNFILGFIPGLWQVFPPSISWISAWGCSTSANLAVSGSGLFKFRQPKIYGPGCFNSTSLEILQYFVEIFPPAMNKSALSLAQSPQVHQYAHRFILEEETNTVESSQIHYIP